MLECRSYKFNPAVNSGPGEDYGAPYGTLDAFRLVYLTFPPLFIRFIFAIIQAKGEWKMSDQKRKINPYSGVARRVEEVMATIAKQMPKLSPNDQLVVERAVKVLAQNTRAGAERLAILHLLGTNEAVPGTVLYQLCSNRLDRRVRELQSIGMDICRWIETRPDGLSHIVYGWTGFKQWQAHHLLHDTEEKQPSLRRVM